ncbi:VTT domain-containing protein [Frankia sp. AgPm24]|uniref:VTT domain-containing protein n=1 Tax=Frankia sp. AgPm24 TaxID=631128 RepID=UPI00200BDA2E|nr:VTT domain-containing protein [Frankia sp. AgPm24]MCK9924953.1 VTT domain-containing protein [Frankia sp. AgPm24]
MTTLASNTLALGPDALSADSLVKAGLVIVLLIVFAESGLLIGFFLPGDSLLFTVGMLISRDEVSTPLPVAVILIGLAAVAGDQVGYLIGRRIGPSLFSRPNSRLFKREHLEQANEFFAKNGPKSIVLARFVPIVRTFTPVIAGVGGMNYRVFAIYNVIGGLLWGCGITLLGYFLGSVDFIHDNIEAMLILVVAFSVLPMGIEMLRARRRRAKAGPPATGAGPAAPAGDDWRDDADAPGTANGAGANGAGAQMVEPLEPLEPELHGQPFDSSATMRMRRGGGSASGGSSGGGRHSAGYRN